VEEYLYVWIGKVAVPLFYHTDCTSGAGSFLWLGKLHTLPRNEEVKEV